MRGATPRLQGRPTRGSDSIPPRLRISSAVSGPWSPPKPCSVIRMLAIEGMRCDSRVTLGGAHVQRAAATGTRAQAATGREGTGIGVASPHRAPVLTRRQVTVSVECEPSVQGVRADSSPRGSRGDDTHLLGVRTWDFRTRLSRGGGIRTPDLLLPKQVRCQVALLPGGASAEALETSELPFLPLWANHGATSSRRLAPLPILVPEGTRRIPRTPGQA